MYTGMDFFMSPSRPHPQHGGAQRSPIFGGFLLFYVYTELPNLRTTKFDVVTHVGEGCASWGQPRLPSQESRVPELPNF